MKRICVVQPSPEIKDNTVQKYYQSNQKRSIYYHSK